MENINFDYEIIRDTKHSLRLTVSQNGKLTVRAPIYVSDSEIEDFVLSKKSRIESRLKKSEYLKGEAQRLGILSADDVNELKKKALEVIGERTRYFADMLGVTYGKVSVKCQKTRWGSCSSMGNLNFNYLLMLAPKEVLDSVIVHELCHRKYMNHSKIFYEEVLRICPNYKACSDWLKENGKILFIRGGAESEKL